MKKKLLKETMRDNNGFSLVELIIVIAIMAVLVGVISPQYLKYVEKARVSTDVTNAQEIAAAVAVAYADGTITAGGKVSELTAVTNLDTKVLTKSNKGAGKDKTFYVTIADNGNVSVYAGEKVDDANIMYPTIGSAYTDYVTK